MIPDLDNKPKFKAVTIGPTIQNQTQILEGLRQSERVFIDLPKDRRPKDNKDK
jgi:HlyD family secretion protein